MFCSNSLFCNNPVFYSFVGQIAIGTDDVYNTAKLLKEFGGKVTREPGPIPGINTKITAVLDPDGWKTVSWISIILK